MQNLKRTRRVLELHRTFKNQTNTQARQNLKIQSSRSVLKLRRAIHSDLPEIYRTRPILGFGRISKNKATTALDPHTQTWQNLSYGIRQCRYWDCVWHKRTIPIRRLDRVLKRTKYISEAWHNRNKQSQNLNSAEPLWQTNTQAWQNFLKNNTNAETDLAES